MSPVVDALRMNRTTAHQSITGPVVSIPMLLWQLVQDTQSSTIAPWGAEVAFFLLRSMVYGCDHQDPPRSPLTQLGAETAGLSRGDYFDGDACDNLGWQKHGVPLYKERVL